MFLAKITGKQFVKHEHILCATVPQAQ
jgi:hypothetical protein